MRETIADRLIRCGNRPAGFDYLRLILSSLVVLSHTINVVYGTAATETAWASPWGAALSALMPLFFALSGFLVAGSLERCRTMVSFVGLRVLRLVPALAVDTAIAALLLGPLFTSLSLSEYFRHPETARYAMNVIGDIHFTLPGVFEQNPLPLKVNGQLWTLPWELRCYAALTLLALLQITQSRSLFLAATVLLSITDFAYFGIYQHTYTFGIMADWALVECFLFGVVCYLWRDRIVLNRWLFAASAISTLVLLRLSIGHYLVAVPAVYSTVYLGMRNPRRTYIVSSGDYSYGIFLYGMPIQQAVVATLGPIAWPLHFALSYAITFLLAIFSWWCVEKPALALRGHLYALEARITGWAVRLPFGLHLVQPAIGPRLSRPPARQSR